jgi:hypothetical protein
VFILKLLLPTYNTRNVKLSIPDTVVYVNSKAKIYIREGNDKEFKITEPRHGFSILDVRKLFIELDYRKRLSENNIP